MANEEKGNLKEPVACLRTGDGWGGRYAAAPFRGRQGSMPRAWKGGGEGIAGWETGKENGVFFGGGPTLAETKPRI